MIDCSRESQIFYASYFDFGGVLYTNLPKTTTFSPWRMYSLFCSTIAKLIPFIKLLEHHFFIILIVELSKVNFCNTFNKYRSLIIKFISSNIFSFFFIKSKINSWPNSSILWGFESFLCNKSCTFMFGTMVNDGSFRAISGEMVGVAILANHTKVFLMLLSTFLDLAHLSKPNK